MKTLSKALATAFVTFFHFSSKAQVPVLSSYPDAEAVIFLDFDGHTVEGTVWNYNGPIHCAPTTLTPAKITEVFNRVAEDYRPFNINITTDSTKFLAAPVDQRMRVILTVSSAWYGSAGGVAFVNSFSSGDDTPCFIFTALLNNNVKNIAEATAHEAGHTLGLYHQASYDENCNKLSDYSQGTGSGEIGWAPIMGVGYYRNFTLWNIGPSPYGCNSIQSDLDVITSETNGFGYRVDDHGNDFATSTLTTFSNSQFQMAGIVEKNTDEDYFRFTVAGNGRFELEAIPYNVGTGNAGSDLDMQVTLFNSDNQILNVYNPGTLLHSIIDTTLNAGTYYVKVEGKGNAYATDYASLGSYSLKATATPGTVLPVHRLELRAFNNGDNHELSWEIVADENVVEQTLQISTDGRNFETLIERDVNSRSYAYRPLTNGPVLYRLKVVFDDGRQYYSNVASIRQSSQDKPSLMGNMIQSGLLIVASPSNFEFVVHDLNGRRITAGKLQKGINNINLPSVTKGMYLIRYIGNVTETTEKFLVQ